MAYECSHGEYERSYASRARAIARVDALPAPMNKLLAVLALLAFLPFPAFAQDDAATFPIESITVTGASSTAARIVVAESHLREGDTYDESQLRDAAARIQRLPFVIWTDFRLEKGTTVGSYVLVIQVRQLKPLFVNARSTTRWTRDQTLLRTPTGLEDGPTIIDQASNSELSLGARKFIGAKGVLNLVAQRYEDRNDRYTATFTQYDLFRTRASITAVVSYLEDPGGRRSGHPNERYDWHFRDNLTWELIGVYPLTDHDSIRASWQRSERPVRYFVLQPSPYPVLRSLPQIRKEVFWIHDSTNDPLFPTRGTRLTVGATRTSTPHAGFTILGRSKMDEYRATIERTWTLPSQHALTLGGHGWDSDRTVHQYRAFGRYSIDLWGRERTLRAGDLRLEIEADRQWQRLGGRQFPNLEHWRADTTARVSVAYRNVWGVLRFELAYNDWRQP